MSPGGRATDVPALLLAHDAFVHGRAKTAEGYLRYNEDPVAGVIDRAGPGRDAGDVVGARGRGVPVVASFEEARDLQADRLVIGVAPVGGRLPSDWHAEVRQALEAGLDVVSGLHDHLAEDPVLARAATEGGARIQDLRRAPPDKPIYTGEVLDLEARVLLTVGTDCSVGKMTTTVELTRALRARGVRAAWAATGQTGLLSGADAGVVIDAVGADFVAGWSERVVLEAARAREAEVVLVEGQGALSHPAYGSVSLGLLHGASPHGAVLCHDVPRKVMTTAFHGERTFPVHPPSREWARIAALAVRPVDLVGVALMRPGGALVPPDGLGEVPTGDVLTDEGREQLVDAVEAWL